MQITNVNHEKRFACIEHICIYFLCTCDTSLHVGVGGGDMQLMEHHLTCNVFGKVHIWNDRIKLSHATVDAFRIAQSTWYMHKFHILLHTCTLPFKNGVGGGNVQASIFQPGHA